MALPIKNGKVGTDYGVKNHGNIQWMAGHHQGVDFPAPVGTPILSVADGVVEAVGTIWGPNFGNHQVIVKYTVDGKHFWAIYAHGTKAYVKKGDKVTKGQHIADVGAEGHAFGPHLHFEVHPVAHWDTTTDVDPHFLLKA